MTSSSSAGTERPVQGDRRIHAHAIDAKSNQSLTRRDLGSPFAGCPDERPVDVVVQLFASDFAIRECLDPRALLGRNRPLAGKPLVDQTLRHAEFFGERGLADPVLGEVVGEVHAGIIAPLVVKSRAALVAPINSIATVGNMKKASTTTGSDQQTAEARRLTELFKEKSGGMSQEEFGARYNIGTQGMMWQLLNGRRPLNLKAAVGFAQGLNIPLDVVSPTIAEEVRSAAQLLSDSPIPSAVAPHSHTLPPYVEEAQAALLSAHQNAAPRELFDAVRMIFSLLPSPSDANIKPLHNEPARDVLTSHSASKSIEARAAWTEQEAESALKSRGGGSRGVKAAGDRKRKGARH